MKRAADEGVGGPARGATAHAQGTPVAKRRRTRGGKKRRPTTRLTPDDAFRVAEVVEELVRDVCARALLLPPQLWPCDDHLPCDSEQTFSKDDRVDKRHRHDRYDRPAPKPVRTSGYRAPQTPPGQPSRAWGVGGGNAPRKMPRSHDVALCTWQRTIATPTTRARDQTKGAHGFVARVSDGMGRDARF